jgi:hypothetical protein
MNENKSHLGYLVAADVNDTQAAPGGRLQQHREGRQPALCQAQDSQTWQLCQQ